MSASKVFRSLRFGVPGKSAASKFGYLLGRTDTGPGAAHPVKIDDLLTQAAQHVQTSGLVSHGANPAATASDVAVNGSASTFLRSDGAPAVQKCSSAQFGLCKVDNTTITATGGVISAVGGSGLSDTPWYPSGNINKPSAGTFTLTSHLGGGASASLNNISRGIYLLDATAASGDQLVAYYAVPSTPYTLTMGFLVNGMPSNFGLYGLCFLDSSVSKNITFGYGANGGDNERFDYQKFSALGTYSSDTSFFGNLAMPKAAASVIWLKVLDDGTNFTFSGSFDGEHFFKVQQVSRTDFLSSINYVGFQMSLNQLQATGVDHGMEIFSFKQS